MIGKTYGECQRARIWIRRHASHTDPGSLPLLLHVHVYAHVSQAFSKKSMSYPHNAAVQLLFISYKFVKGFLVITFLLLVISS